MAELTQQRLKEILDYDPASGEFRWKEKITCKTKVGERAGRIATWKDGSIRYREICFKEKIHKEHRLVWLWVHGYLPERRLIHINGNPTDNRIENLHEVVPPIKEKILTQSTLKSLLHYDPETGEFRWLTSSSNRAPMGTIPSNLSSDGYLRIRVAGKQYRAHRLAWLYVYGKFPSEHIDHINHDILDNRIENLRDSSPFKPYGCEWSILARE